ncbi:putative RNA 3'-terminal phosphate cyclase-like protein [Intoshia linei]|uniref:Putative RNA 3'-terminal phosphate cyclase-like protein n=1 Tax=Intoshia linei TaxID=1819745 RepID=A0A177AW06_9BILA|nr:putative RNA 3'-terminal phosphate cyclase-like protein [Intoshia linei]
MTSINEIEYKTFENTDYLIYKLLLSTVSGKPILINSISKNELSGIQLYEVCLIRLVDKLTNGSEFIISPDGTKLTYKPGLLIGGKFDFKCNKEKSISYYLELVMLLSPFCRDEVQIKFNGVSHKEEEKTVEFLNITMTNFMKTCLKNIHGESIANVNINQVKNSTYPCELGIVKYSYTHELGAQRIEPLLFQKFGKISKLVISYWRKNVPQIIINENIQCVKDKLTNFLPSHAIRAVELSGSRKFAKESKEGIETCNNAFGFIIHADTKYMRVASEHTCFSLGSQANVTRIQDMHGQIIQIGNEALKTFSQSLFYNGAISPDDQVCCLLFMSLSYGDISKCSLKTSIMLTRYRTYLNISKNILISITVKLAYLVGDCSHS